MFSEPVEAADLPDVALGGFGLPSLAGGGVVVVTGLPDWPWEVGSGLSDGGGVVVASMAVVVQCFVGRVGLDYAVFYLMNKRLAWSSVSTKKIAARETGRRFF